LSIRSLRLNVAVGLVVDHSAKIAIVPLVAATRVVDRALGLRPPSVPMLSKVELVAL
jgi:hypothetical protein